MKIKLLASFAAILLLAACAGKTQTHGDAAAESDMRSAYTGAAEADRGSTVQTQDVSAGRLAPDSVEYFQVNVGDTVNFAFDSHQLDATARQRLELQAAWLRSRSDVQVRIEGHCDERGTREYNLALGARRAEAVKRHLVALGISANRISTISYGEERPLMAGSNEAAWAANRRGVTTIRSQGAF